MCSMWCRISLVFSVITAVWPLVYTFSGRIRSGDVDLDVTSIGMLWRLRVRALRAASSLDEFSLELRLLHVITIRKEFPAVSSRWRMFIPAWRILGEWETGFREAGDGQESETIVTWEDLKEWHQIWRRWQPVIRAFRTGARFARRRLRVKSMRWHLRFGLGDAAATARAYGYAWMLFGIGLAFACRKLTFLAKPEVAVQPVYNARLFHLNVEAHASMFQVEAVIALIISLVVYVRDKIIDLVGKVRSVAGAAKTPG